MMWLWLQCSIPWTLFSCLCIYKRIMYSIKQNSEPFRPIFDDSSSSNFSSLPGSDSDKAFSGSGTVPEKSRWTRREFLCRFRTSGWLSDFFCRFRTSGWLSDKSWSCSSITLVTSSQPGSFELELNLIRTGQVLGCMFLGGTRLEVLLRFRYFVPLVQP